MKLMLFITRQTKQTLLMTKNNKYIKYRETALTPVLRSNDNKSNPLLLSMYKPVLIITNGVQYGMYGTNDELNGIE